MRATYKYGLCLRVIELSATATRDTVIVPEASGPKSILA